MIPSIRPTASASTTSSPRPPGRGYASGSADSGGAYRRGPILRSRHASDAHASGRLSRRVQEHLARGAISVAPTEISTLSEGCHRTRRDAGDLGTALQWWLTNQDTLRVHPPGQCYAASRSTRGARSPVDAVIGTLKKDFDVDPVTQVGAPSLRGRFWLVIPTWLAAIRGYTP
jgi:hypothetical protein